MNKLTPKVIKTLKFLRGFFPQKLPTGVLEFNQFCSNILDTYNLPHLPSYKHALASMIMHLGPTTLYKSPWFFAVSVKKSMANQTAYEMIQQIKEEAELKAKEEKLKQEELLKSGEGAPELEQVSAKNDSLPIPEVQKPSKKLVRKA